MTPRDLGTLSVVLSAGLLMLGGCKKARRTHPPGASPTTTGPSRPAAKSPAAPGAVFREETDSSTGAKYWICVPTSYRPETPAPLIVSCHGMPPFDVAEHHAREWRHLAEKHGCIVLAPTLEGTDGVFGEGPAKAMAADEKVILSIISTTAARYNIDKANVMLTGFSGGGFPTYWVGLRHPETFSVIVGRSCNFRKVSLEGGRVFELRGIKPPVMISWDENDPRTIVQQSREGVSYLRKRGYNVEAAVLPGVGHDRHPEVAMGFFLKHRRQAKASFPTQKGQEPGKKSSSTQTSGHKAVE